MAHPVTHNVNVIFLTISHCLKCTFCVLCIFCSSRFTKTGLKYIFWVIRALITYFFPCRYSWKNTPVPIHTNYEWSDPYLYFFLTYFLLPSNIRGQRPLALPALLWSLVTELLNIWKLWLLDVSHGYETSATIFDDNGYETSRRISGLWRNLSYEKTYVQFLLFQQYPFNQTTHIST